MMRKVLTVAALVALGTSPFLLLLGRGGSSVHSVSETGAVWPYCAPDASPPSFKPLPYDAAPDSELFVPTAVTFLHVTSVPASDENADARVIAVVNVSDSVQFGGGGALQGDVAVSISVPLLTGVRDAITVGDDIWLAADSMQADGTPSISFAVDSTRADFLAPDWTAGAPILARDYLRQRLAADPSASFMDDIFTWNKEWFSEQATGPYSSGWRTFLQPYGIGLELQTPGTIAFWNSAPSECRSYFDAPSEITSKLPQETITVLLPTTDYPRDAVICARTSSGGMGCSEFDAGPQPGVVRLDVFNTGEPVAIQLAHETSAGVSWFDRVTLTTINLTGDNSAITVDLRDLVHGLTYAEAAQDFSRA
jgi:hypothetical protein